MGVEEQKLSPHFFKMGTLAGILTLNDLITVAEENVIFSVENSAFPIDLCSKICHSAPSALLTPWLNLG